MKDFRTISKNLFILARNINVQLEYWAACILSQDCPKRDFFFFKDRFLIMPFKKHKLSLCSFPLKLRIWAKNHDC